MKEKEKTISIIATIGYVIFGLLVLVCVIFFFLHLNRSVSDIRDQLAGALGENGVVVSEDGKLSVRTLDEVAFDLSEGKDISYLIPNSGNAVSVGKNGENGKDGANGSAGANGATGATGQKGDKGDDGTVAGVSGGGLVLDMTTKILSLEQCANGEVLQSDGTVWNCQANNQNNTTNTSAQLIFDDQNNEISFSILDSDNNTVNSGVIDLATAKVIVDALADIATNSANIATNASDILALQTALTTANGNISTLTTNLNTEITNRTNADTGLQTNVNNLTTTVNGKADKTYVDNNFVTTSTLTTSLGAKIDKTAINCSTTQAMIGSGTAGTVNCRGITTTKITADSTNFVTATALRATLADYYNKTEIDTALSGKQATLVSGTNIKTINGQSLLGSGNLTIASSTDTSVGTVHIDSSSNTFRLTLLRDIPANSWIAFTFSYVGAGSGAGGTDVNWDTSKVTDVYISGGCDAGRWVCTISGSFSNKVAWPRNPGTDYILGTPTVPQSSTAKYAGGYAWLYYI